MPSQSATPPRFNAHALDNLRTHARLRAAAQGMELLDSVAAVRYGRVCYLNQAVEMGNAPPWHDLTRGRLWLYHLHYFDFARVLAEAHEHAPSSSDRDRLLGWIHDWIDRNPPGTDVAWDAFCISARLLNWAVAEAVFRWDDTRLRASYEQQTQWLLRHIEWDIRANHLLKNACALTVAAQLFGGAAIQPGRSLLEAEVAEQILPDGGHIERCPMYHGVVLEDLLLVAAVFDDHPMYLRDALSRMTRWAMQVRHPDGCIPLFGDSAHGEGLRPNALARLALDSGVKWETPHSPCAALPDSGYYIAGWDGSVAASRILIKACGPEPSYQPGHAHADPFTYEYTVSGVRMVVDTGVHGYAESPWRDYCRGVRAHNCAVVDGREPMDAWGVFRIGRRYRTRVERWSVDNHGVARFSGWHDGFAPQELEREITLVPHAGMRVVDRIVSGRQASLRSYIHLAPGVSVSQERGVWRMQLGNAILWLVPQLGANVRHEAPRVTPPQGWHFDTFGGGAPSAWFEIAPQREGDASLGYALVEADSPEGARSGALKLEPEV